MYAVDQVISGRGVSRKELEPSRESLPLVSQLWAEAGSLGWPVAFAALDVPRGPPLGPSGLPFSRHLRYVGEASLSKVALLHPAVAVHGRYLGANISGFVFSFPRWAEAQRLVVERLLPLVSR